MNESAETFMKEFCYKKPTYQVTCNSVFDRRRSYISFTAF